MDQKYDAVVVGSGPNGLAAAITLAENGCSVLVLEARERVGGGARTAELTLPGFQHDVCSAIHPMGALSPLFRRLPLHQHGLSWIDPPVALAHPLDDGRVALLSRSLDDTARGLHPDTSAYLSALRPLVDEADALFPELLKPLGIPRHPKLLARFGWSAMKSAKGLARDWFKGSLGRALFCGCAAHSFLPLDAPFSAAIGLTLLVAGHAVGWPCAKGGSQSISDALAKYLSSLGGTITTGHRVATWSDIPRARAVLFDSSPRALVRICGDRLPSSIKDQLTSFRLAPGIFKLDWALSGPIPWRADRCALAGTVHLGGTFEEIAAGEASVNRGEHPTRPYVLVAQQSLFDATRAPAGKHTGWAYCHVPNGSTVDMTEAIENQIERFAPGFRDIVLGRHATTTADLFRYNENCEGGDISGGANDYRQLFARPRLSLVPYSASALGIYLCSSSTPPGAGVHGMCGFYAASAALREVFGKRALRP
jgi:phytoene dehydrogenase-like protein